MASRVLTPAERHACGLCVEALKEYQKQAVADFVQSHASHPLLFSYSCDSTRTKLHTTSSQSAGSSTIIRKGHVKEEFLMAKRHISSVARHYS